MQPTLWKYPFSNPDWLFEPKWDGYRAFCSLVDGEVRFLSRRRSDLTPRFPSLQVLKTLIKAENAILDGEIMTDDDAILNTAVVYPEAELLEVFQESCESEAEVPGAAHRKTEASC